MGTPAEQTYTSGFIRLTRPQFIGTIAGLMMCLLLAALDQTIVGTAEPRIIASLSGFDRYPWVATVYLLTSTICVPIFAKLSDMYGRKWFFLSGAVIFVTSSALCGAAGKMNGLGIDGMSQLIVFRGFQGLGAGIMFGLVFTIVGDVFSPAERGKYQGLFASVWGAASIFGPTLGGWLTDLPVPAHDGWRWCFYVNLPVGIIAIAAIWIQFPYFHPQGVRRIIDWAGVSALIACLVPLLLALTWVTQYGWTSTRVEVLLAVAVIMLFVFLFVETHAAEPLIPLSLFRDPIIRVCSIAGFMMGIGMFGVIIYLPLFMQGVLGVSATRSGSLLTPMMLAAVTGNIFSGQNDLAPRQVQSAGDHRSHHDRIRHHGVRQHDGDNAQFVRRVRNGAVRHRPGLRAAGLHRGGAECRSSAAHGYRNRTPASSSDRSAVLLVWQSSAVSC